eukprot:Hpha_TRINITY_DN7740_c0_g1::TRINITY_DN7740_c0_g1_i1::g.85321::m.85321
MKGEELSHYYSPRLLTAKSREGAAHFDPLLSRECLVTHRTEVTAGCGGALHGVWHVARRGRSVPDTVMRGVVTQGKGAEHPSRRPGPHLASGEERTAPEVLLDGLPAGDETTEDLSQVGQARVPHPTGEVRQQNRVRRVRLDALRSVLDDHRLPKVATQALQVLCAALAVPPRVPCHEVSDGAAESDLTERTLSVTVLARGPDNDLRIVDAAQKTLDAGAGARVAGASVTQGLVEVEHETVPGLPSDRSGDQVGAGVGAGRAVLRLEVVAPQPPLGVVGRGLSTKPTRTGARGPCLLPPGCDGRALGRGVQAEFAAEHVARRRRRVVAVTPGPRGGCRGSRSEALVVMRVTVRVPAAVGKLRAVVVDGPLVSVVQRRLHTGQTSVSVRGGGRHCGFNLSLFPQYKSQ